MKDIDVSGFKVMKSHCASCPFKCDKKIGRQQDERLASKVIVRNHNDRTEQICHGTEGPNREPRNLCKGYQDRKNEMSRRLALIHKNKSQQQ